MRHTPEDLIDRLVSMYGRPLIKRGFMQKDRDICAELEKIGLYLDQTLQATEAVWLGYERVMKVTVGKDKKIRSDLTDPN